MTGCDEDSIHGIVYIPPENYKYCCLHGDFNSRTSKEPDFIDSERESGNDENVEHLFIDTSNVYMLEELGIPLRRANEDKVINQYVRKLLDFCKYNDVFILNGRIGEEKEIGKFTCKNVGVVDYTIASPGYLKHITNSQVLEFSNFFSDVHCPISIFIDHVKGKRHGLNKLA